MIGLLIVMLFLCGCSAKGDTNIRTDQLDKENQTEMERIYEVEETVIKALCKKDTELLKELFSEEALSKAGDMEQGIDYMFNLYQGDFVEIVDRNHSSNSHVEKNKSTKDVAAWCIIKTTEGIYKLSWVDWIQQEENPTLIGIYSMHMREYEEGDYRSYYRIAGIDYPERERVHSTIEEIHNALDNKNSSYLQNIFSQTALSQIEDIQISGEKLFELFPRYLYSDIDEGWVTYSEVEGTVRQNIFVKMHSTQEDFILYFCYDETEEDKISILKLTNIEDEKSLSEYELGDNYIKFGLFLQ